MGAGTQISQDYKKIKDSLEHALLYPSKDKLGEEGYHQAHVELQEALYALERVMRIKNGSYGKGKIGIGQ